MSTSPLYENSASLFKQRDVLQLDRKSLNQMTQTAFLVFPALMAYAAASDLLTMKIPNWLTGGLVLAFPCVSVLAGLELSTLLSHVSAGAILLAAGLVMFAAG